MDLNIIIQKLCDIDKEILGVLKKTDTDFDSLQSSITKYIEIRKKLRRETMESSVALITDPAIKELFIKIKDGHGLKSDTIIETLFSLINEEEYKIDDLAEDEIEDLGSDLLYSWFSHYEYIQGLADLRPLTFSAAPNQRITTFISEIKKCYAFQQYNAAYSLCRTLIETCVREIIVKNELMPDIKDDSILFENHRWYELRIAVAPENSEIESDLKNIYSKLCKIIHGRQTVSKNECKFGFKTTLEVVEKLYSVHGL